MTSLARVTLFKLYVRVIWCDLLHAYVPCLHCFGAYRGHINLPCIVMISYTSACVNMPCLSALIIFIIITAAFSFLYRRLTVLAVCTWSSLGSDQPSCWPLRCGGFFSCRSAVDEGTFVSRRCDLPVPVTHYLGCSVVMAVVHND